jgi:hypothetical protein
MKLQSWGAAALAVCALLASGSRLQAKQVAVGGGTGGIGGGSIVAGRGESVPRMAEEMDAMEESDLGSYNDCNTCSSGASCSGGGGFAGMLSRPIQIVAGAEYIYAKANFSDALAYVEQDLNAGGETWHCFDFNYNSSYGFYGGVYLPDCGGAMLFNFRRLTSDADTAATSTTTNQIFGPFEIDDNITGHANVDLKTYDLSFAKTIPLGCPLECGCGKNCGDSCDDACCSDPCSGNGGCTGCGGGWCPAWDITWWGGVRFADVNWSRGLVGLDPLNNNQPFESYQTTMNFKNGFGGRVGLMGRRYIGKRGLMSLYARGDWSVLLGNVELETLITNQAGTAFIRKDCEQIIPVTEIELGGSVHLGAHSTLSAGYFWSAWHDLGTSETYDFNQFQVSHYDDGNILGFDGLFARVEVAF